ncbi:unnamed protein product [marine sediment metagenome]|uniref:Pyruvate/ketoisovalerate oxidoreductase catalytic domain-containing protein n=1 Tax=marine sediment metagenome TaxID=412755 RepID=X0SV05_9ZZZZ
MSEKMTEIRWHGRGGQGAKTAATLIAQLAIQEGKFSQGFPEYGPERMGAPIRGYTRISDGQIRVHSPITRPDISVVLDPTLLETVNVCEGLTENGIVIVNTTDSPKELKKRLGLKDGRVFTIDATRISIEEIGKPIPNTPMMGALIKATGILKIETVISGIEKKFGKKFGEKVVQGNINAIKRGYEEVKSE